MMQQFVDELIEWSGQHAVSVNGRKTKEMLIGPIRKEPPPPLSLDDAVIYFLESMCQTIFSGRITLMQSATRLHIVYIF